MKDFVVSAASLPNLMRAMEEELIQRIEKKRGKEAATRLYRGMRDEYLARKARAKDNSGGQ